MKKTTELTVPELNTALFGTSTARTLTTAALVTKMLDSGDGISDLVFSPGRPPQVERFGNLVPVQIAEMLVRGAGLASSSRS